MAVFPDRIVLKNSADTQAAILAAIGDGGTDEILPGEIVVGTANGSVSFYVRADDGTIVTLGSTSRAKCLVSGTAPVQYPGGAALEDGDMWFNPTDASYHVYYSLAWVQVSGGGGGGVDSVNGQTGVVLLGLGDLSDVDTTSAGHIPTDGQVLAWDQTMGHWMPVDAATGGGGASYLTETRTASAGAATFTSLGHSGILQKVTSSLSAWIVIYGSAADRTADAGRSYSTDPSLGSGVMAEFYVTAGATVLATPAIPYFNNDTTSQEAIYLAVRDQAGSNVDSEITISAYG